jgi:hypothetical protein
MKMKPLWLFSEYDDKYGFYYHAKEVEKLVGAANRLKEWFNQSSMKPPASEIEKLNAALAPWEEK